MKSNTAPRGVRRNVTSSRSVRKPHILDRRIIHLSLPPSTLAFSVLRRSALFGKKFEDLKQLFEPRGVQKRLKSSKDVNFANFKTQKQNAFNHWVWLSPEGSILDTSQCFSLFSVQIFGNFGPVGSDLRGKASRCGLG